MKVSAFFFFNDTATTEIYTLSLHDALPISLRVGTVAVVSSAPFGWLVATSRAVPPVSMTSVTRLALDRKSTRLNSSHANISYAVFCLKKKKYESVLLRNIISTLLHYILSHI